MFRPDPSPTESIGKCRVAAHLYTKKKMHTIQFELSLKEKCYPGSYTKPVS